MADSAVTYNKVFSSEDVVPPVGVPELTAHLLADVLEDRAGPRQSL